MEVICCYEFEEVILYYIGQRFQGEISVIVFCFLVYILKVWGEIIRKCDVVILQQRREIDVRVYTERREKQKIDRKNEVLFIG